MSATLTQTYDFIASSSSGLTFPPSITPCFERIGLEKPRISSWIGSLCIKIVPAVGKERSSCQTLEARLAESAGEFVPRTELGKRLISLRNKAIEGGVRLLSEDEVLQEATRRRGELEEHETDLY